MKWFKHMSGAHTDDKIVVIRERFGMWGVGCYWTLLEMVAEQMKVNNPKPLAVFNISILCSLFECKRNKLVSFLKHLRNQTGINVKQNGNIIEIEIPKLLQIKDNYLSDLEEASKKTGSIEVEEDVDVHKEEETATAIATIKDLDSFLLQQWGRDGNQPYSVKTQLIDLARKHGFEKLDYAIREAANHNARSLAYVKGILEPKDKTDSELKKFIEGGKK